MGAFSGHLLPALHRTREDHFVVDLDLDTCFSRSAEVLAGGWFHDLRIYDARRQLSATFRRRSSSCLLVVTLRPDGPASSVTVEATAEVRGLLDLFNGSARAALNSFRGELLAGVP